MITVFKGEYMVDFNRIFNLEKNYDIRNKLILSYYNDNIDCMKDSERVNVFKNDLKVYEECLGDINSRLSDSDSYCDRMSLLVERDKYMEFLILSCGISIPLE